MKQLQVLVISDQKQEWEGTDRISFKYYTPQEAQLREEELANDWNFAILDEPALGYLQTNAIAKQLNANGDIPIIYLVEDLDEARKEDKKYIYSIGLFHKSNKQSAQKGGLDAFIQLFYQRQEPQVQDAVFIFEKDNFYQKIPIQEILWIEALQDHCRIITMRRPYTVSVTLEEFESRFKHPSIVRIHDEYLVNITKVSGFDSEYTVIHQSRLPFSINFRSSVTKHFNLIGEL